MVERIAEAIRNKTCSATRIRISLSPEHLGDLLIELALQGSVLHGKVVVESDAARDLILSQLDRLRDALEGQGLRMDDLQVTVDRPAEEIPEERHPLRSVRPHLLDLLA